MSIRSRVKSVAKKVASVAKGAINTVKSVFKDAAANVRNSASKQTASVADAIGYKPTAKAGGLQATAIPGGIESYNAAQTAKNTPTGKGGSTTYYNNYVPSGAAGGNYVPVSVGSTPYGPPKTISSGKQSLDQGGTNSFGGVGSFNYGPQTISSKSFDGGESFAQSGGISSSFAQMSSTPGTGVSPVTMPSNPGSINPNIDTTALAGKTAGLYERQADGTFKEVVQNEKTMEDKAQETVDLYNKFLGEEPNIEDDREIIQAREQKRLIQEALRAPTNELNAVIAKQNADILAHRKMISESGGTETGFGGVEAAINYNAAIRALPLQASIASLQGDLELATDYLTELRQVKSEQIKRQYDYRKGVFEAIRGVINTEDERAYKEKVSENDRSYKEEQKLVDLQAELSMKVMQNAPDSVRTNIVNRINSAGSIQDAIMAAGKYGVEQNTEIRQLDNGETVVIDKNTNKIVSNLGGAKSSASSAYNMASLTPEQANDPFIKKLVSTAGGKPLTDTFAQKLDKGLTVLGQIGSLQANIKDIKTGPIVGAFKGANPWDTNAQTIKAQLNAIVPNLARGVYGEVGVLTDNDIAQYSKTLPNLKSTEDIRNAVLGITVDLIGKSIKRTLEVNAANGKDVSGFVDLYTEMQSTRDSIFSQIPGYTGNTSQANVAPELQSLRSKYGY